MMLRYTPVNKSKLRSLLYPLETCALAYTRSMQIEKDPRTFKYRRSHILAAIICTMLITVVTLIAIFHEARSGTNDSSPTTITTSSNFASFDNSYPDTLFQQSYTKLTLSCNDDGQGSRVSLIPSEVGCIVGFQSAVVSDQSVFFAHTPASILRQIFFQLYTSIDSSGHCHGELYSIRGVCE